MRSAKTAVLMLIAAAAGAGAVGAWVKWWPTGWVFWTPRNPALATPAELRADVAALGQEEKVLHEKRRLLADEQTADRGQLAALIAAPVASEDGGAKLALKTLEVEVMKRSLQVDRVDAELRRIAAAKLSKLEQLVAAGDGVTRADVKQLADEVTAQASGTPRAVMAEQFALLMGGKVGDLKAHFTDRVRDKVTPQAVSFGRKLYRDEPFPELAARFETDPATGACVVRTTAGRELTRLVKVNGKWKADVVWFD